MGTATQTIDLVAAGYTPAQLDSQDLVTVFGGRIRSSDAAPDATATLAIAFLDASGNVLGQDIAKASNVADRWELVGDRVAIPVGTRGLRYTYESLVVSGSSNDSCFDGAFLRLEADSVTGDQGAYGDTTPQGTETTATHVALHAPDLYVDWPRDIGHLIQWTTFGNTSQSNVRIDLYQDGPNGPQFYANITPATPDTGSYFWEPSASGVPYGTYGLRIEVSLVNDTAVMDRSTETFAVPESGNSFYVAPPGSSGGVFTTAGGSNRNTGKLPSASKPSPAAILQTYSLGPTQTVYVDAGNFLLFSPLVISGSPGTNNNQGFTMTGPAGGGVTLQFANPLTVANVLTLSNSSYVTLNNFTLGGSQTGITLENDSTNFSGHDLTISGNARQGILADGTSSILLLDSVVVSDNGAGGISAGGSVGSVTDSLIDGNAGIGIDVGGSVGTISGNVVSQNGSDGIHLSNAGAAAIVRNQVENNLGAGITVSAGNNVLAVIGNSNLALGLGNIVADNSRDGIDASGNVLVAGNTVYGQTGSWGIYASGASQVEQNVVYGNYDGIGSDGGVVTGNRVYNNSTAGLYAWDNAAVEGNDVYDNTVGIQASGGYPYSYFSGTIANNLVYDNSNQGIVVSMASSPSVVNNTVYQSTGNAVDVQSGSQNVQLRNNTLWVLDGSSPVYDLSIAPDSEQGFASDFNDLYVSGLGRVANWQGVARPTLAAWQDATGTDKNSFSLDPLFVDVSPGNDPARDDFHEDSPYGYYQGGRDRSDRRYEHGQREQRPADSPCRNLDLRLDAPRVAGHRPRRPGRFLRQRAGAQRRIYQHRGLRQHAAGLQEPFAIPPGDGPGRRRAVVRGSDVPHYLALLPAWRHGRVAGGYRPVPGSQRSPAVRPEHRHAGPQQWRVRLDHSDHDCPCVELPN